MRAPNLTLAGNLRWTRSGTVWADWLLTPLAYGFRPDKDKDAVRTLHRSLFRSLPGESLLLRLCAGLDPAAVVERMVRGVDLHAHPDWAAECEATLDTLDAICPGQRVFWLSVPLGDVRGRDRLAEPARAAFSDLRDALGLPRAGVTDAQLHRRAAQARTIAEGIPAPFRPRPVTPAQMVWLHLHAQQRGLFVDVDLPDTDTTGGSAGPTLAAELLTPRAGSVLGEAMLDEGGQSDLPPRSLKAANPLSRRYLKVSQPDRVDQFPASYQSMLVLSDVPSEGMQFPGSEFLGRIDESGIEVDWALRLLQRSSAAAQASNRRSLRSLNEQFSQRDGEVSHGLATLDRAAAELADYAAVLEEDKHEVELQATTVFAVAGQDPDSATAQARALADFFAEAGYKLTQPLGYQEQLWWAMTPGAPAGKVIRDYAQITTSRALSAAVPLASTDLGDWKGSLLGLNVSTGRPGVVLHDPAGASAKDVSGSLGTAGELGAGKALALDTPIPTPSGWARMGDLAVGDRVFDETGHPTEIDGVSPVMVDHRCFEVVFSDGSTIIADAEHLWTTLPDRIRSLPAKRNHRARAAGSVDMVDLNAHTAELTGPAWATHGVTATTQQLADTLTTHGGRQANHAIPTTAPLDLPDVDLPVDPYVLGAWLGDGSKNVGQITSADPEILAFIAAAGYQVTKLTGRYLYSITLPAEPTPGPQTRPCRNCGQSMTARYSTRAYCSHTCARQARRAGAAPLARGICEVCRRELAPSSTGRRCATCWHSASFRGRLGLLGVLRNKHIPTVYLRASERQRRTLLAGLMDTDGTVAPAGACQFTNTSRQLAHDVHELACSLGYRATLVEGRARLEGRDCGPKWTVAFTTSDAVFHLPRKAQAQMERTTAHTVSRTRYRYVTAVREVPSQPVRCIRVAAASRLFLAGPTMIATHNSVTLKKLAGDVVDTGGVIVVPDRTAMGEWAEWADSVTVSTVVDVADPKVSLDPLRLFGAKVGARVAQSFLTPLLNIAPTSERGVLLAQVLDAAYLCEHGLVGLGQLLAHLEDGCALPGAAELGRVMNVYARNDLGRVVFDSDLPPLQVGDARAVIVRTHTLQLPSRDQLEHEHLFKQMSLEKTFGRAMYALIAALARRICFANRDQLGVFVVDEAHHITASPEGELEIVDFIRDGRKHAAAVFLGSHDPEADFGSSTLRGLIPTRLVMRQRDVALARRSLEWLGLDPTDETLLKMLMEDTSPVGPNGVDEARRGEAFLRDSSGNIGRIKVLPPALPSRNAAVRTSPPEVGADAFAVGRPAGQEPA